MSGFICFLSGQFFAEHLTFRVRESLKNLYLKGENLMVSSRSNARLGYDVEVYNHTTADTFSATLGVMW